MSILRNVFLSTILMTLAGQALRADSPPAKPLSPSVLDNYVLSPWNENPGVPRVDQKWIDAPMSKWMEQVTREKVQSGNIVEFMNTAYDYYPVRLRLIREAKPGDTIDVQTYWWCDDVAGLEVARELAAASLRGVRVRVIIDYLTSIYSPRVQVDAILQSSAVQLLNFNPTYWGVDGLNSPRAHEKIMIYNGSIALVGGGNLCDVYMTGKVEKLWRDFEMEVSGPAVRRIQARFDETARFIEDTDHDVRWNLETILIDSKTRIVGQPPRQMEPTPSNPLPTGNADILFDYQQPYLHSEDVPNHIAMHAAMIERAKKRVILYMPYLVPRPEIQAAMIKTAQSGRKVVVITNSVHSNDNAKFIALGAVNHYPALLKAGVEIYEINDTVLHGKAMLVDDVLLSVGSHNLDSRSSLFQGEANIMTGDQTAISKFTRMAEMDMFNFHRVTLDDVVRERKGVGNTVLSIFGHVFDRYF